VVVGKTCGCPESSGGVTELVRLKNSGVTEHDLF